MAHAQKPFAQAVKAVQWQVPRIPVYSNTTAAPYPPDPAAIAQTISAQMLNPVRFKEEIEAIYAAGGRIFVEVGSRNILTNLVQNILADKPHVAISLNPSRQKDNDRQFREAIVQLQVVGLSLSNIDPYLPKTAPLPTQPKKGWTIQLNGSNYVAEATKLAFEQALQGGHQKQSPTQTQTTPMQQPKIQPAVQSPLPVKPVPSKTSTDSSAFPQQSVSISTSSKKSSMSQHQAGSDSFERLMMRFYEHQADLLRVHEQYLHDQQEMCYRFLQLMQQHYAGRQVEEPNLLMAEAVSKPFPNDSLAKPNQQASAISTAIPATLSVDLPIASQPVVPAISSQSPMYESTKIADLVDGNGGLHPETQTTAPPNLADSQNAIAQIQPTPAPGTVDVTTLAHSLLEVVSDKTGYPVEMLEIEMDMEAELGIDSIKRVEILGAMQELFPDLPPVNSEALAELRTLQQVVDYMGQQAIVMKKKTAALA